eukprot:105939_1
MAVMLDTDNTTPNEKVNTLQIACITIKCRCGECDYGNGDELYICKHTKCSSYLYCMDCGPIMHTLKAINDHAFNTNSTTVISLNTIMNEKENTNKSQYGQHQLMSLIGVEQYNQIAPYFVKPVSLLSSNVPMCAMLVHELTDFYKSVELAVKAANAAQTVMEIDHKASVASEILRLTLGTSGDFLGSGSHDWFNASSNLMEELLDATDLKGSMAGAAKNALNNTMSMTDVIKAGGIGMAIGTGLQLAVHSYRVVNHQISFKEWCRLSGKTLVRNAASLVGTAAGGKLGAIAGCHIGVTTATISAGFGKIFGGSVGIVSGMICGYVLGKTAEWVYEKYLPPNEQQARKQLVQEALIYFHFQQNDIKNKNKFNKTVVGKRFKQIALDVHPDRNGGNRTEWNRLSIYYGVLKALLEQSDDSKDIVKGAVMRTSF